MLLWGPRNIQVVCIEFLDPEYSGGSVGEGPPEFPVFPSLPTCACDAVPVDLHMFCSLVFFGWECS